MVKLNVSLHRHENLISNEVMSQITADQLPPIHQKPTIDSQIPNQ